MGRTFKKDLKSNVIAEVLWALALAAFLAVYLTVPCALDDYWYLSDIKRHGTDASGNFNVLSGFWETVREHYLTDNARWANVTGAAVVLLPVWVSAVLTSACIGLTWLFMRRLSLPGGSTFIGMTVLVALYTFAIPWSDGLFTRIYALNYIWAAALATGCAVLFVRDKAAPCVLSLAAGLVTGLWHEIYSFPLLVGALLCMDIHRGMVRKDRLTLCIGLAIGCAWLWLTPARTHPDGYGAMFNLNREFGKMLPVHTLSFVLAAFEIIGLCVARWRKAATSPQAIIALSYAGICAAVHLTTGAERAIVPAVIMDAVGIVFLGNAMLSGVSKPLKAIAVWGCAFIWAFLFVHMGAAFVTGLKIRHEEDFIMTQYEHAKDTDGVVFADITDERTATPLALGKPIQTLYRYYSHQMNASAFLGGKSMLKVIPPELREYTDSLGTAVGGDKRFKAYRGRLIAGDSFNYRGFTFIAGRFDYSDRDPAFWTLCFPFTAADSCLYYYFTLPADGLESIELYDYD